MSFAFSPLPDGFSWLSPAYRPSEQEVDAYAHVIANAEGFPGESNTMRLYREAELQLWIWRAENRKRGTRRKRAPGRSGIFKANRSRPMDS